MNESVKRMLEDMAAFEKYNGRVFPAKAYENALKTVGGLSFELAPDNVEDIKGLPAIGDGIFRKIKSFLADGTFERYEEFKASDASKLKEMTEIKGIGMVMAKKLFAQGVTSLEKLRELTDGLPVGSKIPGTDVTYTNAVKIGLTYEAHTDKTRMPIGEHGSIAWPLIKEIEKAPGVKRVSAAGSARRYDGSENYTVGDVDLIVGVSALCDNAKLRKLIEGLLDEVTMSGPTKISGIKSRRAVDVRIVDDSDYEALLLHATGSMSFNIYCRNLAIKRGWTLNEYGLFDEATGRCLSKSEEEILKLLGVGWVDPKDRKNFK